MFLYSPSCLRVHVRMQVQYIVLEVPLDCISEPASSSCICQMWQSLVRWNLLEQLRSVQADLGFGIHVLVV